MAIRIKVGDTVKVLWGDDRNWDPKLGTGRVTTINHGTGMVVVEGMNKAKKNVRRSQKNPQGGKLEKEMPIQICRVQFVCPGCTQPTRLGSDILDDGSKVRQCKKCGWQDEVSPPKSN